MDGILYIIILCPWVEIVPGIVDHVRAYQFWTNRWYIATGTISKVVCFFFCWMKFYHMQDIFYGSAMPCALTISPPNFREKKWPE